MIIRTFFPFLLVIALLPTQACRTALPVPAEPSAAAADASASSTVRFLDRTIDLRPYLEGFPYGGWNADFEAGVLFYSHTTPDGVFLMTQPLGDGRSAGQLDPAAGGRVNDIDWSTRNLRTMRYHEGSGDMIVMADERNDEIFNLYRLSLRDGSMQRLTSTDYIYGFNISPDGRRIAYVSRTGIEEPRRSCLRLLDADGSNDREILCEEGAEFRLTWSTLAWRPDGSGLVLRVNRDDDRNQGNIAWVDLTAAQPRLELLLPREEGRFGLSIYRDWIDGNSFYYSSDETGYSNLYRYDLTARTARPVTSVTENATFTPVEIEGRRLMLTMLRRPHENVGIVTDPATGAELGRRTFDAAIGNVGFDDRNRFYISRTSAVSSFQLDEAWIILENGRAEWRMELRVRLPELLASRIEQCNVERVEIPTFDTDPATGESRMLHAFLLTPKRPLPDPDDRFAVITAFYGGGNVFNTRQQIYCEAGISWLSPAVRGSSGFGAEFQALNDRDLGGNEIVDLFYGARFLEKRLGLRPHQIGVTGGSHGGYATMRALTFPPETKELGESYDFGFGISHAGFSSIISFFTNTNIPDWILLESGDPVLERDKLLDRSPLTHVHRLEAPLLLTHGENDNRVGVAESRAFYQAARALDRPVTYVEFEGQGHGIVGLPNLVRLYQVQFDFLEGVAKGSKRRN